MSRERVEAFLYLLSQAFEGDSWHSLLSNLRSVHAEHWALVPPGGRRSIREIVRHVGGCTFMYENYAFGDGTLTWDDPLVNGDEVVETAQTAIDWLYQGHRRFIASIASLQDRDLDQLRQTNWGEAKGTSWIISVITAHDFYHAGEVNHIRSVLQQNDLWAYERPG